MFLGKRESNKEFWVNNFILFSGIDLLLKDDDIIYKEILIELVKGYKKELEVYLFIELYKVENIVSFYLEE